ncbi:MAG: isoleucine--tRNA ligase [Alistipes sp.]|jgi:isoleucyl-tRNA synthetase|nr:isoleucine--tRNA ligase [Alistipes sp.]
MSRFKEYKGLDLVGLSAEVLAKWDAERTFERSLETRAEGKPFVFYEGPPSANGMPGIHHMMARTIKDIFCRYKTQQGFLVRRKAGWDTHGLPVELGVEKKLGITKDDIGTKISIEDYNRACREAVMEYTGAWEEMTRRMGYWVDMGDPYVTYDPKYMETLWWMLRQLFDKGLLYKGYTIQPYSPAAGTGLSNHELNQPGCYRDVKDTTITAQFRVVGRTDTFLLAWTTTPWTLPSNTALAVNPAIDYVEVECANPYSGDRETVILAAALVEKYFAKAEHRIVRTLRGSELLGLRYEQLLPWVRPDGDAFRVIAGDYVTTEDGTGIVHIAPTFGADDARVAQAAGIAPLFMVDAAGKNQPMVDRRGRFWTLDELDPAWVAGSVNVVEYERFAGKYVKPDYEPAPTMAGSSAATAGAAEEAPTSNANSVAGSGAATSEKEPLDVELAVHLKAAGLAFKIEKYTHNYPHCWRTDKPILYYPLDSWFIRTTAVKDRLIELNETIKWRPESTGSGRFGKWLEGLVDWNLSRSRFWGTPLPIWATDDYAEMKCIGSVAELRAEIERSVAAGFMTSNPYAGFVEGDFSATNYEKVDLHRPYVDNITLVASDGRPMKRETDLIDVWFDSGAMPYAQAHYPFEFEGCEAGDKAVAVGADGASGDGEGKPEGFEGRPEGFNNKPAGNAECSPANFEGKLFPADFIAEGVDQTRGWFFTLHALGTMLFDGVAFKNIISNGLVLDRGGNKMSKRLGNAVDPFEMMDKYGVDAVRWYMITNSQPWDNLKFDAEGVDEVRRKFFGTLYNTYSFFALYANVDGFRGDEPEIPVGERPEIDRWIVSLLNTLVAEVTARLEDYDPTPAARAIAEFVNENLSNWYVRLNRKRFWGGGLTQDKLSAYQTLHECLETVAGLCAPFAPFFADRLWSDLNAVSGRHACDRSEQSRKEGKESVPLSVHLAKFPEADRALVDVELERMMAVAQQVSSMVLALRRKVNIKVRQPLSKIVVPVLDAAAASRVEAAKSLIAGEVNVKEIELITDTTGLITKSIKPNFKTLGKKYGKQMKAIAALVAGFSQDDIARIEADGGTAITMDGETLTLAREDFEITSEDMPGWLVASDGPLTVALDVTVTDELRREGVARELVNRIQNLRKESGLEVVDKISVQVESLPTVVESVVSQAGYIASQVLANEVVVAQEPSGQFVQTVEIDERTIRIAITKL